MKYQQIDTILTDVGGVLIAEYSHTGVDVQQRVKMDDESFHAVWPNIVARYGAGKMDEQAIWRELAEAGGDDVDPNEDIIGKPFAENLEIFESVMNTIRQLSKAGFTLGILSNTVAPHAAILKDAGIYTPFGENVFLSNEIGIRKPATNAYELALSRMNIRDPKKVLYIDDRPENLTPAIKIGMQVLLAESENQIASTLKDLLRAKN